MHIPSFFRHETWVLPPSRSAYGHWSNHDMDPVSPSQRTWTTWMLAVGLTWYVAPSRPLYYYDSTRIQVLTAIAVGQLLIAVCTTDLSTRVLPHLSRDRDSSQRNCIAVTSAAEFIYGEVLWDPLRLIDHWDNRNASFFAAFTFLISSIGINISAEQSWRCERSHGAVSEISQYYKGSGSLCTNWRLGNLSLADIGDCSWVFVVLEWLYGIPRTICGHVSVSCRLSFVYVFNVHTCFQHGGRCYYLSELASSLVLALL
ncbi:hypothetical protein C0995_002944 [Termitomyces sp. Mi166|nr:hypothetical protein C0995_002944 [Termitomyces sp. Mi166\